MQQSQPSASHQSEDDRAFRKFFYEPSTPWAPGTAIHIVGGGEDAGQTGQAAIIPEATPNFQMVAEFEDIRTGHYIVRWRLKLLENFSIPNGLRFAAGVSYDGEGDITGSSYAVLSDEELTRLEMNRQYEMVLGESLIVQPHTRCAHVKLSLSSNEAMDDFMYSGLEVIHVEIKSTAEEPEVLTNGDTVIIKRRTPPKFTLDYMQSHATASDPLAVPLSFPVTRLAWSKEGMFLASLALSPIAAYIAVWDMSHIGDPANPAQDMSAFYQHGAVGVIDHQGIDTLSIGLAISANGDQVAIYQEPQIGEWTDGSPLEQSTFQFQLFSNPLVPLSSVAVNMVQGSNGFCANTNPGDQLLNGDALSAAATLTGGTMLRQLDCPHELLRSFIGYGAFLPPGGEDRGNSNPGSKQSQRSTDALFAECDGLSIRIFSVPSERKWEHLRTVWLTDLAPVFSRRMTCKMMMDSIGRNVFMWLESRGCCSIWNLNNGSNESYIYSTEGTGFKDSTFQGVLQMALSPDGSIAVFADANETVTTYYTNSGVAINDRHFPGCMIEHVGFHGNSHQLCVVTRDRDMQLMCRIMDPLQLTNETIGSDALSIPVSDSTIFAFFRRQEFKGHGIICEATGSGINCYNIYRPSSAVVTDITRATMADLAAVIHKSSFDENIQYRLRTFKNKELLAEGVDASYCVLQVEVIEENMKKRTQQIIFSFIPEPWVRVSTNEPAKPASLLSAFFLPCRTRFAMVGLQTIQIWCLPTPVDPKCSLQFVWSQPKTPRDVRVQNYAYEHERAKDSYLQMKCALIYTDVETGGTVAEIEMKEQSEKEIVQLPGAGTINIHFAILHCFRSAWLLAAAYAFSNSRSSKTTEASSQWMLSFKDHADAIIQFTHKYINHKLFLDVSYSEGLKLNNIAPKVDWEETLGSSSRALHAVSVLTLLLEVPYLQDTNHIFVEGLLHTSSCQWIPDGNPVLNPIGYAINIRNKRLLNVLIDYCTSNAKLCHPAYVVPIAQCLDHLLDRYPNDIADIFRKMSYIPAPNQAFATSHASRVNWTFGTQGGWNRGEVAARERQLITRNVDRFERLTLTLPSKLGVWITSKQYRVLVPLLRTLFPRRTRFFPQRRDYGFQSSYKDSFYKIYTSPFLIPRTSQSNYKLFEALFVDGGSSNYFDCPVIMTSLEFRWYNIPTPFEGRSRHLRNVSILTDCTPSVFIMVRRASGYGYWRAHFGLTFIFSVLVMVITAQQIRVSSLKEGQSSTADDVAEFLMAWGFLVTTSIGVLLLLFESKQLWDSPITYLSSLYNYIELVAFLLPIVGGSRLLEIESGMAQNIGDSRIWIMGFGILFLYLNMLFELRVFSRLGIAVNIIINITRRIKWFFFVFILFLVGFTHALLYVLHMDRNKELQDTSRDAAEKPDGYPTGFFAALSATFFFLSGRFDPINTAFKEGLVGFHILMIFFYFFTAILLINVLIAVMNDSFNASQKEGMIGYWKLLSEISIESDAYHKRDPEFYPRLIYYGATNEGVMKIQSKYSIPDASSLSVENRYIVETSTAASHVSHSNQRAIIKDITSLGDDLKGIKDQQESNIQDMDKIKDLVSQNHEDMKQELAQLRDLVKELLELNAGRAHPNSGQ